MLKVVVMSLLVLSMVCMVPLMGTGHTVSSHLHHDASVSCATCMGPESVAESIFFLTILGTTSLMTLAALPLPPIREQFHPPRVR